MKQAYIIFTFSFLSLFASCTSYTDRKSEVAKFGETESEHLQGLEDLLQEYSAIIEAILKADSAYFHFVEDGQQTAYLKPYMHPNVINDYKEDEPEVFMEIYWEDLREYVMTSEADSIFIAEQTNIRDTVYLSESIRKKHYGIHHENKLTTLTSYEFYRPVLSADSKRCIVNMDFICGHWCGNGWRYTLEKINGVWTIISKDPTWIA